MGRPSAKYVLAAIGLAAIGLIAMTCGCGRLRSADWLDLPRIMLWAWERPENLNFVDPQKAGVAFLAGTDVVRPDGSTLFRLRTQQLTLPPGAAVLPVVRIESPASHAPIQIAPLLLGFQQIAGVPGVRGIQIDFDARRSERPSYRTLLASMPKYTSKPVGITALASWCEGDRWLDREPVAEAVPMFFRMGPNESRNMRISSPPCRSSIGLSTDEPWPVRRSATIQRIYLFSPRAWTREEYDRAMRRIETWK
jgi:hypothetical protein